MDAIKLSEKHICKYLPARFSVGVENETKKNDMKNLQMTEFASRLVLCRCSC